MTTDREILESLAVDDPWAHSYEGLGDSCMFCGSDDESYADPVRYRHELTCPWIKAMAYLGREHPEHGFVEPRPPVDPCEICLADPDATLDSHVAHLGREWAQRQEDIALGKIRPYMDSLPVFQAERGGIKFVTPPAITRDGEPIAYVEKIEVTDTGIVASGPMVMPPSPMYDFLGRDRTFTPDTEDIEAFERAKALRDGQGE